MTNFIAGNNLIHLISSIYFENARARAPQARLWARADRFLGLPAHL